MVDLHLCQISSFVKFRQHKQNKEVLVSYYMPLQILLSLQVTFYLYMN